LIGVGSQLVAQNLNLIGTEAGCRHPERVPVYLNNLDRLGLARFPREPIDNPQRYQVLEAQPDALAAIKRAGRAKTVHRSVELTPFGRDFCEVCLPSDEAEIEALIGG
jgi:Abortive infection alpha